MTVTTFPRPVPEGLDLEGLASALLRKDAEAHDKSYADYCYEAGIVGPAQQRRIERHEVLVDPNLAIELAAKRG